MTLAPVEAQVQEFVIHNFTFATGWSPTPAGVTLAPDGIYGTSESGGTSDDGVVNKLDTAFHYTVLHNFTGADGVGPNVGVIRDSAGNLYGTTSYAINGGARMVYKLDADGNYTVLYRFPERIFPDGVILGQDGLYGTTETGGTAGDGVVYKLDASAHYTVLYNFTGGADSRFPQGGVVRTPAGNLIGTTSQGGSVDYGVVFVLTGVE
jgi:uncharacterized repeat protein (TIGR03803 family)